MKVLRHRLRLCAISIASLLISHAVSAQDGPFTVRTLAEPASGLTDSRPFTIVLQIDGKRTPAVVQPTKFPEIDGLQVVSGPHTLLQTVRENRQVRSSYRLSYTVIAERPGQFQIPEIRLEIDNELHASAPITIQVKKGNAGMSGSPSPGKPAPQGTADPIFLEAQLAEDEIWVGQPVPISVTLFGAYRITNISWQQVPDFRDFWVELVDVSPDRESFQTRIGDVVYTGYPIDRRMLVPLTAGEFKIEPYVARVDFRQPTRDAFDFFNRGRTEAVLRKTPELSLNVKPLPAGEPAGFSGAVGRFTMEVSVDRDRAKVNDAVALRATIEGEGSLQSVGPPELVEPEGVKIFEPKVTESTQRVTNKMVSRKTWEWIVVPLDAGELEIPDLAFSYFDPSAGRYETSGSDPILVAVERGSDSGDPTGIRSEIQLQRRDLAYIKPLRGELAETHTRVHQRPIFRLAFFAPFALTPLLIVLGRRRALLRRDLGLSRAKRAGSKARRHLQSVEKRMDQLDSAAFHEEVARTLVEYVADLFNRSPSGMTYELAEELLAGKGVSEELRRRFRSCLETCDFARFVPSAGKSERRSEIIGEAREVLVRLEAA